MCGPFRGLTGYDHHVREFVRELARQGVAVELSNLPLWSPRSLPRPLRDPWFETLCRPVDATTVLHFCMPHQVRSHPDRRNVNFSMFEATPAPADWIAYNRQHDHVIVPTESSRQAWVSGGLPEEHVSLCPLGVNPEVFGRPAGPLPLRVANSDAVAERRVRFLNVSEIGARKNLIGLLRTWLKATCAADDAVLILKIGHTGEAQRTDFQRQADALRLEGGKRLVEAAPVCFLYDIYSDSEMPRLYASATHYLSMSFGEGWDQPAMEAAASGLRLIVPRHSAYTAYLEDRTAMLTTSRSVPVEWNGDAATGGLFAGARWWSPDEDEAARYIRDAIEGRDAGKATPQSRVLSDFTWAKAVTRLREILDGFEPRRRFWRFWSTTDRLPARIASKGR